jgi:hypothetical protein
MSGLARAGGLLAVAVLSAACGRPDDFRGVPAPQSVVPGTAGRECYFVNTGDATPVFSALARPGARGNVALWGRDLSPGDSAELSVRWDDDGALVWVETIRANLPPDRLESLESLLLEAVADTARPDWGVRLWMVGGDIVYTEPSVICPPRPRGFSGIVPRVMDPQTAVEMNRLRGRRFPVQIRIDDRGNVLGVTLVRQTGSYAVDQYLLEYVWRSNFWPKLHDGIGIASTLEINIEIPRRWR